MKKEFAVIFLTLLFVKPIVKLASIFPFGDLMDPLWLKAYWIGKKSLSPKKLRRGSF